MAKKINFATGEIEEIKESTSSATLASGDEALAKIIADAKAQGDKIIADAHAEAEKIIADAQEAATDAAIKAANK